MEVLNSHVQLVAVAQESTGLEWGPRIYVSKEHLRDCGLQPGREFKGTPISSFLFQYPNLAHLQVLIGVFPREAQAILAIYWHNIFCCH